MNRYRLAEARTQTWEKAQHFRLPAKVYKPRDNARETGMRATLRWTLAEVEYATEEDTP